MYFDFHWLIYHDSVLMCTIQQWLGKGILIGWHKLIFFLMIMQIRFLLMANPCFGFFVSYLLRMIEGQMHCYALVSSWIPFQSHIENISAVPWITLVTEISIGELFMLVGIKIATCDHHAPGVHFLSSRWQCRTRGSHWSSCNHSNITRRWNFRSVSFLSCHCLDWFCCRWLLASW